MTQVIGWTVMDPRLVELTMAGPVVLGVVMMALR